MSDLLTRAELVKLSRALGAKPEDVAFLAPLGHLKLRQLEDRLSALLFDEHRGAFQRLADSGRLLPASLVAKMSELVFGPMLSARVSGLMAPERAIEVAGKLHTKFLAEVCVDLDPRSASELLWRMPTGIVVDVAQVLLKRGEHLTMARFVDDLTEEAIRAVTESIDDEALLRIGAYVERPARLEELMLLLPPGRLAAVVARTARGAPEVQAAGLTLMSQLGPKLQARIGEIAIGLGAEVLNALLSSSLREEAGDVVRSVMVNVGADSRAAFLKLSQAMDDATRKAWTKLLSEAWERRQG
jgi:hypothetical protein